MYYKHIYRYLARKGNSAGTLDNKYQNIDFLPLTCRFDQILPIILRDHFWMTPSVQNLHSYFKLTILLAVWSLVITDPVITGVIEDVVCGPGMAAVKILNNVAPHIFDGVHVRTLGRPRQ
ncbi:hypothetical protein OUZ56_018309 [Daphnia magna]|uniref:Uncharacterized protein n=1 Tax=Daphnia magna TaxID=35525 RepID=A0ABQ9Z8H3_9CRUS|nr:hypothetical protein OUZ56_018309 [Daphnia magna]